MKTYSRIEYHISRVRDPQIAEALRRLYRCVCTRRRPAPPIQLEFSLPSPRRSPRRVQIAAAAA